MSLSMILLQAAAQPGLTTFICQRPSFEPDTFHNLRFGHRGGCQDGPENTLALLNYNVVHKGMRAAEIDLQLTRDGHLVLFHDPTVFRMLDTDLDVRVAEMTLAELQAIPYRDRRLGTVYVSTLKDLLQWFQFQHMKANRPVMLELDFKAHGKQTPVAVNRLMAALDPVNRSMGGALGQSLFVSSFYPEVLKEIRKYSKHLVLGFSFNARSEEHPILGRVAALMAGYVMRKFGCKVLAPNVEWLSARRVARWKKRGFLVSSYPVDTAAARDYLDGFGIAYATSEVG